eukprot:2807505-Amphidinium_carterae.4
MAIGPSSKVRDLGASPASMEASKFVDFVGMLPGNTMMQSDAEMAYVQATLKGCKTWVRLSRDRWPDSWEKYRDPVVPLVRALYGHPDSGGDDWQKHCEIQVRSFVFRPVPDWPSTFMRDNIGCVFAVYVDDFKMAGPKDQVAKMLELLSTKIKMDKPTLVDRFLGCHHMELDPFPIDGHFVRRLEYDMRPNAKALKKVATPYIPDTELCPNGVGAPQSSKPEDKRITTASKPDDTQNLSAAKAETT